MRAYKLRLEEIKRMLQPAKLIKINCFANFVDTLVNLSYFCGYGSDKVAATTQSGRGGQSVAGGKQASRIVQLEITIASFCA